ncbi:hypothetical protein ACP70R_003321 [Stipagrostis hirtigluma subsp. patula]
MRIAWLERLSCPAVTIVRRLHLRLARASALFPVRAAAPMPRRRRPSHLPRRCSPTPLGPSSCFAGPSPRAAAGPAAPPASPRAIAPRPARRAAAGRGSGEGSGLRSWWQRQASPNRSGKATWRKATYGVARAEQIRPWCAAAGMGLPREDLIRRRRAPRLPPAPEISVRTS